MAQDSKGRTAPDAEIDTLNSFLRGEISAVESYGQALAKLEDDACASDLRECRQSHSRRVEILRSRILSLGGDPAKGSGAWGTIVALVEAGAKLLGKGRVIAALEQGEDIGRDEYRDKLDKLDSTSRVFIQQAILPEQERTHAIMSRLQRGIQASSQERKGSTSTL